MAATLPQSVAPGVAFEIDLEQRKTDSPKSTIQKRLENSPRRGDTRLEDVQAKLKRAYERKGQLEAEALASTASHNAKVKQVHETSKAEAADKLKSLSEGARKRLEAAEAKRDGHRDSWMKKLGAKLTDKKQRGEAKQEEAEWAARDLAAKIDIAAMSADLRRHEANLKVQETLAASNNDKLARGKLALDLSALEAEKVEERSQQKLVLAEARREMLIAESSRDTAAARAEKVAEARRLEEEAAALRKAEIEAKLLKAEERKDAALAGKVETLASRLDDKAHRAAEARKKEETLALEKRGALELKLQSASARKAQAVRQQQQLLHRSASKKEMLVLERQEAEEKALAEARANVHAKLQSASARKETLLKEKVDEVKGANQKKQTSANKSWLSSLKSERRLKDDSEKRLKAAAQRKETLLKEKVDEAKGANRQRAEQVEAKQKAAEKADVLKLGEIEQKIASASAKRDEQLGLRSTSKKRQLSPSSSPRDKAEIEARIEAANTRREQFLAAKVEKAQKSPRITRTLFSAVSPSPGIHGSGENLTSRMKAARLEEFERSSPIEEKSAWGADGGNPQQPPGLGMIALGSGLAVVLVGLFSFLKK
ncbi:hypothetical protein ACHAXT_010920 [Thalassiosira profunda]